MTEDECFLCAKKVARLSRHINSHWESKTKVSFNGIHCLPCKRDCTSYSYSKSHYHCFVCSKTVHRKIDFEAHLMKCWRTRGFPSLTALGVDVKGTGIDSVVSAQQSENVTGVAGVIGAQQSENVTGATGAIGAQQNVNETARGIDGSNEAGADGRVRQTSTTNEPVPLMIIRKRLDKIIACNICSLSMRSQNLIRHKRNFHQIETIQFAICVDSEDGQEIQEWG